MNPRLHSSLTKDRGAKRAWKIARKTMLIYIPIRSVIAKFRKQIR